MAIDRRYAIRVDGTLQAEKPRLRTRSEKSSVDRSYHCNLPITGNAHRGDFCFVKPFAFEALDRIAPDFGDVHGRYIDDLFTLDDACPLLLLLSARLDHSCCSADERKDLPFYSSGFRDFTVEVLSP